MPEICTKRLNKLSEILLEIIQNVIPKAREPITVLVTSNSDKNLKNDTGASICPSTRILDNQDW